MDSFMTAIPAARTEGIADAAGPREPNVTRAVYPQQISDTVTRAPAAMDRALAVGGEQA